MFSFFNKAMPYKYVLGLIFLVALVPVLSRRLWIDTRVPPARKGMEISELIRQVKAGLESANAEAQKNNEAALFQAKTFELELTFVVEASTSTEGKTDYHLVAVDNTLEAKSERTQKITIHMDVVQPERVDKPAVVGGGRNQGESVKVMGSAPPTQKKEDKCPCKQSNHH